MAVLTWGPGLKRVLAFRGNTNQSNNRAYVQSAVSGTAVEIGVDADSVDANVDLKLVPKGTGNIRFGTYAAGAATDSTGYITIKDAGGTARKLMVQA